MLPWQEPEKAGAGSQSLCKEELILCKRVISDKYPCHCNEED